jgi:hypothetical protein
MPLNKLENFIKNYEGRILYVNSNDLDATDSITNQGNSLTKPFKTIQRALIEASRFSFVIGEENDYNGRTTILVFPGEHIIDNRPGFGIRKTGTSTASAVAPNGDVTSPASSKFTLTLESNFDLSQEDNVLYKFNSIYGGAIIPRGTSIVGLDLRKTKIRPKYVPNPTDELAGNSAIFRLTGQCYFWQFTFFDADENSLVYTDPRIFSAGSGNLATPTFSHHKLTCFEYTDGVNIPTGYEITDLDMYYAKLSQAFNEGSGRQIPAAQKYPLAPKAFTKERAEWEIVGAFAEDPVPITNIISGDGATPSPIVTVTTIESHELTVGTPIKIRGLNVQDYNVSTVVASVIDDKNFTYILPFVRNNLPASPSGSATVTIETDTVKGASPYVFNCSLRSVWGLNGMHADGRKASGFRSMVVAQFTGVSLQKDDRAFVKYDPVTRTYSGIPISKVTGSLLSSGSASTDNNRVYHLDPNAMYRTGWETSHIKLSNDAFIQIVSVFAIGFTRHFDSQSGGDASITNSNSNFGQIAVVANGFKKEAFSKDDTGYITSIITPKYIPPTERNIDWFSIDVGLTTSVGITSHLYLFGFNTRDNIPPNLIQGYRVGARLDDRIYLDLPNGTTKSAKILMSENVLGNGVVSIEGNTSSVMEYLVTQTAFEPPYENLVLSPNHKLQTGQKIIIVSENGDLPEGIVEDRVYYAIPVNDGYSNKIKVASSFTNASNGIALPLYGGTRLRILSRVSNIDSGEAGSPIQFDPNKNNWFLHVERDNEVYNSINQLGVVGFEEPRTDVTYFKRVGDDRSIDDKVYKVRLVIPKDVPNAKDPSEGFVIQESSTTGALTESEFSLTSITETDIYFNRNPKYISTCTYIPNPLGSGPGTIEITSEKPHKLNIGDRVLIKNVKSSENLLGIGVSGYNGDFTVLSVPSDKKFVYSAVDNDGLEHNVGIFSGTSSRNVNLPRFERNDLKSNLFIYRSDVISKYDYTVQDGIYHLYVLNAQNAVPEHFTEYKYGQNIVNLYPQLDRDNYDDNPPAASTFAKRFPVGDVVTNDLKKSITRETLDVILKKLYASPKVQNISPTSVGVTTITTSLEHGFGGLVAVSSINSGSGYTDGTFYNVRLLNSDDSWNGATAKVIISGGIISSIQIMDGGSGYIAGQTLKVNGYAGSTVTISNSVISSPVNNSIQFTGIGTASDCLFKVVSVPSSKSIAIARTTGDPVIYPGQYLFNVAPSTLISSIQYNEQVGISTVTCSSAHGLTIGNKIKIIDNSNNNLGDYIVSQTVGINTIIIRSNVSFSASRILKYGFSANDLFSAAGGENLASRGVSLYANESAILNENLTTESSSNISTFSIIANDGQGGVGIATVFRFPIGSYIQIGEEIMRVSSSTLSGSGNNKISAIRGYFGTRRISHEKGSLIKKINVLPIEFRRPSVARASGHTFEYLGYGPGNYSTGLPQIQTKTLTDREDFLAQSQEQSAGQVIYTGMNSDGDFFIGNTKYSASSGTQETYDIPIATVTGQDPSRLSVVFDEVIVKERILVEGGKSKQILSQFDGPVTFNENIIMNDEVKINGELILGNLLKQNSNIDSNSTNTGSIITKGGIGISKNVNIGGNLNVTGIATFNNEVSFNSGLVPDNLEDAYLGSPSKPWASAWIAGIGIATEGVPGGTEVADRTINAWTGDLVLTSQVGIVSVTDSLEVTDDLLVKRNTRLTGIATVQTGLVPLTDEGAYLGTESLPFSEAHVGEIRIAVTDDNTIDTATGGLKLQSNANQTTIDDLFTVTGISTFQDQVVLNNSLVPDNDKGAFLGTNQLAFGLAHINEIQIGVSGSSELDTRNGNLILDSATGFTEIDDNLTVSGYSYFTGITTFNSLLDANNGATIDNVQIGVSGNNEIDTSSGNLTIDSAGGTIVIDDSLTVNQNLDITGISTFNNNVNIKGTDKNFTIIDGNNNTRFTVATNTGNTTISGTLSVNGNTTLGNENTDSTSVNGSISVSNGFTVADGGLTVTKGGLTVTAGGLTVSAGGINAAEQTVTAATFNGNATTATTASNVVGGASRVLYNSASNTTATSANLTFDGTTLSVGALSSAGDITAFASDERLKTNIKPLENALEKVLSLSGFTYNFNEIGSTLGFSTKITHVGVSAQQIQAVLPEAVSPAPANNDYLTVKYEKIVPLLIEAIKELADKVEKLEQKLADK